MAKGYTTLAEIRRRYKLVRILQTRQPKDMALGSGLSEPERGGLYTSNDEAKTFRQVVLKPPQNPNKIQLHPVIPESTMPGEDTTTPRISVAPTLESAIQGIEGHISSRKGEDLVDHYARFNPNIQVLGLKKLPQTGYVPHHKLRDKVPDAHRTQEGWLTEPTAMEHVGKLVHNVDDQQTYVTKLTLKELRRRLKVRTGGK
jgi:hypothetical protein